MRWLEFLAQINLFHSGISCFVRPFFFFFENLYLLSFKLSIVRLQNLLDSVLKTAAVLWTVNISAFTVNCTILHYSSCAPKGQPYINCFFFLCWILVQWTMWYIQVSYITSDTMSHLLRATTDWTGMSSHSEKCAVRKCFKKDNMNPQPFLFTLYVTIGVIFAVGQRPNSIYRSDLHCSSAHRCDSCQIKLSQKPQSFS